MEAPIKATRDPRDPILADMEREIAAAIRKAFRRLDAVSLTDIAMHGERPVKGIAR